MCHLRDLYFSNIAEKICLAKNIICRAIPKISVESLLKADSTVFFGVDPLERNAISKQYNSSQCAYECGCFG
jgi:hypothetical protein